MQADAVRRTADQQEPNITYLSPLRRFLRRTRPAPRRRPSRRADRRTTGDEAGRFNAQDTPGRAEEEASIVRELLVASICCALAADQGRDARAAAPADAKPFHPRAARVWDRRGQEFVWRERCGNNLPDHQLAGGFEWERDSRSYIALGAAWVRGKRRAGLIMLSFPDGDVLHAAWPVKFAKGDTWRIQYALTDQAAASSRNGLKFRVTAVDADGKPHTLVERVLPKGDRRVYDERIRFDRPVRTLQLTHDNLGSEVWDVLWILPEGLAPPRIADWPAAKPAAPRRPEPIVRPASPSALRQAVEDLRRTFGPRYPRGKEYLARLRTIERRLAAAAPDKRPAITAELDALAREALRANPLVSGRPIAYVARHQYLAAYHAIDTLYQVGEATDGRYRPGGALRVLDAATGKVRTLVEAPRGLLRSPCVHFDGRKILFAMRRHAKENFHLFEIGTDGTGLRQLTFEPGVSDFDPIYLPDESIVFCSTREPKYNMCSQDIGANLFRMAADGANVHQITRSTLFENQPALLDDGRVVYKRWEYVDRNFGDAHSFWTVNPDGTNQAVVYGNNTADPGAVYYPQPIPGGGGRLLCILSTHHHNMWGPLAILDPQRAVDGKAAILRTWPASVRERLSDSPRFNCDGLNGVRPKYETPWPLSTKHFLCSRMTGRGSEMGLFLIDVFGNEVLLHAEPPSCFSPVPIAPRPRPPMVPPRRDFDDADGLLYVRDVYIGTHMRGVKRGSARRIRIVVSPEKRGWTPAKWYGQGFMAPGMNWHDFTAKRILGSVPVEPDGSAYFAVPSDTFVYFQLLDANGAMIQSMRSGTVLQSGERTGCVGCHEGRLESPPAGAPTPMALRRPPSRIAGWHGPPRDFNYLVEVQGVFDRHCLRCHDFGKPGARKLILAGDKGLCFNASYVQLWRKGYVRAIGAGPADIQPAGSWGARASRLIDVLSKGHNNVRLGRDDLDRLVTWIDVNAPYYPSYYSAYPKHLGGRCPLSDAELRALGKLTGVDFARERHFSRSTGPHVSFDRPELSPCLARLPAADPRRAEALAIIQSGKARLADRPRADMPDFRPCEIDVQREQTYRLRRRIERQSRQALRDGTKTYDEKPAKGE